MSKPKRYASFADFEREEYLRVKSFYKNLEDIMEEEFFAHCDDPRSANESEGSEDVHDLFEKLT